MVLAAALRPSAAPSTGRRRIEREPGAGFMAKTADRWDDTMAGRRNGDTAEGGMDG
jgi:hypothetical protein